LVTGDILNAGRVLAVDRLAVLAEDARRLSLQPGAAPSSQGVAA
jgi:hypothetical protein